MALKALKIYESMGKQIGLVILDYFLPVIDGDAVFEELRSINPKVNVVLSSGFAEQNQDRVKCWHRGSAVSFRNPIAGEVARTGGSTLDAARHPSRERI